MVKVPAADEMEADPIDGSGRAEISEAS